jgi:hypothetical protein
MRASRFEGPKTNHPTNMNLKESLTNAAQAKIRQARLDLSIGWHNPELLEEIDHIMSAIKILRNFETKLIMGNLDID